MHTFTLFHVALSLVGILSGFVIAGGLLAAKPCPGWTMLFFATTVATSLTGFLFPIHKFTPALGFGLLSMVILAVALFALYRRHLVGAWRGVYIVTALLAFYLNFFVLIVQSFQKIPALKALAPTQAEPPFVIVQCLALALFLVLGILALIRFHPESGRPQPA